MWVALILLGWLAASLAMGPWIGRFVAAHARVREDKVAREPQAANSKTAANAKAAAKPVVMARRA